MGRVVERRGGGAQEGIVEIRECVADGWIV